MCVVRVVVRIRATLLVVAAGTTDAKRPKGRVEKLPSGSLRVSVYAGTDPVRKRRLYLREVVPAGPKAEREAQKALRRLGSQVDERRNPRTTATVDQLLDHYFEVLDRDTSNAPSPPAIPDDPHPELGRDRFSTCPPPVLGGLPRASLVAFTVSPTVGWLTVGSFVLYRFLEDYLIFPGRRRPGREGCPRCSRSSRCFSAPPSTASASSSPSPSPRRSTCCSTRSSPRLDAVESPSA
jgi:hypothetical protein